MNLHQRYADALQLAADLAADLAELTDKYAAALTELYQAEADRDEYQSRLRLAETALEKLGAIVAQRTAERDDALKSWAEEIKSKTNGIVVASKGSGEKDEESF